ncbi:MAG: DUF4830 domain-containing protein [Vulcanimicrobiota bacterium]
MMEHSQLERYKSICLQKLVPLFILFLLAVGCHRGVPQNGVESHLGAFDSSRQKVFPGGTPCITIYFNERGVTKQKPVTIWDRKIIDKVLKMLKESTKEITPENLARIGDRENIGEGRLIIEEKPGAKRAIGFVYDSLYEIGYIIVDGTHIDPGSDFFRYLYSLASYRSLSSDVDSSVISLFDAENWTVAYRVRSVDIVLPSDTMHDAGENAVKLYWAWSNDLSKDVGLDFSSLFGRKVTVEVYSLTEPLPDEMKPYRDALGIVLHNEGKIVGAYIDGGFGLDNSCSLKRASHKKVAGMEWDQWVDGHINYNNPMEKELAPLKPEEVIRRYYACLDNHRSKEACALRTRSYMAAQLFSNKRKNVLYEEKLDSFETCIRKVKLISVAPVPPDPSLKGALVFSTLADYKWKGEVYVRDGEHLRYFVLRQETPRTEWRIESICTGL